MLRVEGRFAVRKKPSEKGSGAGESSGEQSAHRGVDERLAGGAEALVILARPPVLAQPC